MEILRCTDRWGRDVVLTDDRWFGKIQRRHPEITEEALELVLTDPDLVNWDKALEGVEVFYRTVFLPPPDGRSLVKATVRFVIDEVETVVVGAVTTAYVEYNINPLEPIKWSRDSSYP